MKDATELLLTPRLLWLGFVVAPAILLLVGQLNVRAPRLDVLVTGGGLCTDVPNAGQEGADAQADAMRFLREISHVTVHCEPRIETDPFARLAKDRVDLLIVRSSERPWTLYINETNPWRIAWQMELARGIQLANQHMTGVDSAAMAIYKMNALGAIPLQPAHLYYPQAASKKLSLVPMSYSLIVCFLAFIVAAPSLVRERELHTLEILLGTPGITGTSILIGKVLLPAIVSLIAAIVMLVLVHIVYGLYIKAGVAGFLLYLLLPILSSTLLGLLVSALARSQVQTVMASAIYFFCLLLLSGFLFPPEVSSVAVQAIARLFGLFFLIDTANAWFFGASLQGKLPLVPLAAQCALYAWLTTLAWRRQLRRI